MLTHTIPSSNKEINPPVQSAAIIKKKGILGTQHPQSPKDQNTRSWYQYNAPTTHDPLFLL